MVGTRFKKNILTGRSLQKDLTEASLWACLVGFQWGFWSGFLVIVGILLTTCVVVVVVSRMYFELSWPWINSQVFKGVKIFFCVRSVCTEQLEQPPSHRVRKGNKYHTRGGISDSVYATIIQLGKLVTPTHASEFKITPLFLTPCLLTLPLCSFSAKNPFKSIPLLLQPSPGEQTSPEATLLALRLHFEGATELGLLFTSTFGKGTGQTTLLLTTCHQSGN